MARGFPTAMKLSPEEIDALVLGLQWVAVNADPALAGAALGLSGKIAAALPEGLRDAIDCPTTGTPPLRGGYHDVGVDFARMRQWSRQQRKLAIGYIDRTGRLSERTAWPFLVGYGEVSRMLMAWCELRQEFRMFRTDRMTSVEFLDQRVPEDRATLRRRWLTVMEERHEQLDPA